MPLLLIASAAARTTPSVTAHPPVLGVIQPIGGVAATSELAAATATRGVSGGKPSAALASATAESRSGTGVADLVARETILRRIPDRGRGRHGQMRDMGRQWGCSVSYERTLAVAHRVAGQLWGRVGQRAAVSQVVFPIVGNFVVALLQSLRLGLHGRNLYRRRLQNRYRLLEWLLPKPTLSGVLIAHPLEVAVDASSFSQREQISPVAAGAQVAWFRKEGPRCACSV